MNPELAPGTGEVEVRSGPDGTVVVAPPAIAALAEGAAGPDTLVLAAAGAHLTWNLFSDNYIPAAVLDDPDLAQQWIWAVYGEEVALAVADFDGVPRRAIARPARPLLAAAARRLAYAHWAARWWPASAIDAIAALDDRLLATEITTLTGECEMLVDGADALDEADPDDEFGTMRTVADAGEFGTMRALADAGEFGTVPTLGRADDYALAVGAADVDATARDATVLARGVTGWDWYRCPPGILDASERAVSWEVVRADGATDVRVRAVAAPGLRGLVPEHLRPTAFGAAIPPTPLVLSGDHWQGLAPLVDPAAPVTVTVRVPGMGPAESVPAEELRHRIRDFATTRLRRAAQAHDDPYDTPLLAEIAAAEADY
ncbi:hypothetical protein [Nocardia aurantia]|uniref:Uncharacterized protein n=1 Tax=Nocardia aurantia TaxID=2585199 RepID=A0A7K0DN63_9NOCA|nr:hypothetical protein [Nocardia aurantia]MQY27185.1 hypothetical protein [Nocardia aurantia]